MASSWLGLSSWLGFHVAESRERGTSSLLRALTPLRRAPSSWLDYRWKALPPRSSTLELRVSTHAFVGGGVGWRGGQGHKHSVHREECGV